jgi:hypothetical protein
MLGVQPISINGNGLINMYVIIKQQNIIIIKSIKPYENMEGGTIGV